MVEMLSYTSHIPISVYPQKTCIESFLNIFFIGTGVLAMTEEPQEDRVDAMSRVFPKMTKCTFHKFGPSGTVEKFDGLCVLPLNIINEKIYVFLWFWFIILTIVTGIQVIYRYA